MLTLGADGGERRIEILGIAGSLRSGSFNRGLIRAAGEVAPSGVRWRTYGDLASIPPYDQDRDDASPPPPVADLRARIDRADALLLATPEYNHSVPGVLKNAVDWASRPHGDSALVDTPTAVIGASPGRFGATWAQEDLRRVLEACEAEVLEVERAVDHAPDRFENGELVDGDVRDELRAVVRELVDGVRSRRPEGGYGEGAVARHDTCGNAALPC